MFNRARLKLTAWYLLIIMTVSVSFSAVIYRMITTELDRFVRTQRIRIERDLFEFQVYPAPPLIDTQAVEEAKERLLRFLITINGGILLVSGGLGYILAGRTLKPISDMLDEQNQFVSDSSHELRTPLTALKTSIEVSLRDPKLSLAEAKELLNENLEEVNRLQLLSDELLQLAAYEQTPKAITLETIDAKTLGDSAVRKIEPIAKSKGIKLDQSIAKFSFLGNKASLMDVLVILLDNAVKYSPEGKTVFLSATKKDKAVQFVVRDEGMGIAAADIPKIFTRFYRADSARTKNASGGYGLGLAIAQRLVKTHRGNIKVESVVGKGSTFTLTLPQ